MTWYSIDTAPKDRPILVRVPQWMPPIVGRFKNGRFSSIPGNYTYKPTHWTPLPDTLQMEMEIETGNP